jgi:ubiquinone/menaquinone biosynthesis C-methylase UbiE
MASLLEVSRKTSQEQHLYQQRFLAQGYPGLESLGVGYFQEHQGHIPSAPEIVACIARLIDLSRGVNRIVDVGCGPNPVNVHQLLKMGYDAIGIEPIAPYVATAQASLGDANRVYHGSAEVLPLADASVRVVLMQSVLEHVDSPLRTLAEAYRVLVPDGVLYVSTTNRHRVSLTGENGEFRTRFYNWFPAVVKESYVFHHLHYDPRLANFTPRPAVHWFTYAELCQLGRSVGFAQFYAKIDLADPTTSYAQKSVWRRVLLRRIQNSRWLRSLALTQIGHIIMWKRP